jgi:hypothetical protein
VFHGYGGWVAGRWTLDVERGGRGGKGARGAGGGHLDSASSAPLREKFPGVVLVECASGTRARRGFLVGSGSGTGFTVARLQGWEVGREGVGE